MSDCDGTQIEATKEVVLVELSVLEYCNVFFDAKVLLGGNQQEYTSITISVPSVLLLMSGRDRILCVHLKKETSPKPIINKKQLCIQSITSKTIHEKSI